MESTPAKKLKTRYGVLKGIRAPWETVWRESAQYVMPRRAPGIQGTIEGVPGEDESRLWDTTAVQANMTLAAGQLSWMSPLEAAWFAIEPEEDGTDDEVQMWAGEATGITRDKLAVSNFYECIHEFYLDRGAFGTACLYVEQLPDAAIHCEVWPVGTFVIDEDSKGYVDTVIRAFELDPRQAEQNFGLDALHPSMQAVLEKGGREEQKTEFLHAILPIADAERYGFEFPENDAAEPGKRRDFASVYLDSKNDHVVKVETYFEKPVMVSRYLRWGSGIGALYGWCPAFAALPEARQANFLQQMLDAIAEKAAFPALLVPDTLNEEVDNSAGGITYYSPAAGGQKPEEWMTQGRYDIGLQRVAARHEAINRAFHVDLFQMFAQLDKQMTATEALERSQEKLIQFSPTFAGLVSETFNPLLERVLGLLLRAGIVPLPPSMEEQGGTMPRVKVEYSSRIALALRALPALGYARTLQRIEAVAQFHPEVLDNFDFDEAERKTALDDGLPPSFLVPQVEVEQRRQQRAQAQAEAKQQEAAMMAAEGAAKLGSVPPGSPVGKLIESESLEA